ncbi:PE family protein [Luteococcus japonicus LSP_Lj1]|uniref:PE family protein n=1 Tax=Luteococcus japonicus LSP_Lj1 TaxID=1255658 RepID=A0A1R4INR5_9ACTN|nr:PE family protein [Luteococcus japonicus LSP_Lj1]
MGDATGTDFGLGDQATRLGPTVGIGPVVGERLAAVVVGHLDDLAELVVGGRRRVSRLPGGGVGVGELTTPRVVGHGRRPSRRRGAGDLSVRVVAGGDGRDGCGASQAGTGGGDRDGPRLRVVGRRGGHRGGASNGLGLGGLAVPGVAGGSFDRQGAGAGHGLAHPPGPCRFSATGGNRLVGGGGVVDGLAGPGISGRALGGGLALFDHAAFVVVDRLPGDVAGCGGLAAAHPGGGGGGLAQLPAGLATRRGAVVAGDSRVEQFVTHPAGVGLFHGGCGDLRGQSVRLTRQRIDTCVGGALVVDGVGLGADPHLLPSGVGGGAGRGEGAGHQGSGRGDHLAGGVGDVGVVGGLGGGRPHIGQLTGTQLLGRPRIPGLDDVVVVVVDVGAPLPRPGAIGALVDGVALTIGQEHGGPLPRRIILGRDTGDLLVRPEDREGLGGAAVQRVAVELGQVEIRHIRRLCVHERGELRSTIRRLHRRRQWPGDLVQPVVGIGEGVAVLPGRSDPGQPQRLVRGTAGPRVLGDQAGDHVGLRGHGLVRIVGVAGQHPIGAFGVHLRGDLRHEALGVVGQLQHPAPGGAGARHTRRCPRGHGGDDRRHPALGIALVGRLARRGRISHIRDRKNTVRRRRRCRRRGEAGRHPILILEREYRRRSGHAQGDATAGRVVIDRLIRARRERCAAAACRRRVDQRVTLVADQRDRAVQAGVVDHLRGGQAIITTIQPGNPTRPEDLLGRRDVPSERIVRARDPDRRGGRRQVRIRLRDLQLTRPQRHLPRPRLTGREPRPKGVRHPHHPAHRRTLRRPAIGPTHPQIQPRRDPLGHHHTLRIGLPDQAGGVHQPTGGHVLSTRGEGELVAGRHRQEARRTGHPPLHLPRRTTRTTLPGDLHHIRGGLPRHRRRHRRRAIAEAVAHLRRLPAHRRLRRHRHRVPPGRATHLGDLESRGRRGRRLRHRSNLLGTTIHRVAHMRRRRIRRRRSRRQRHGARLRWLHRIRP